MCGIAGLLQHQRHQPADAPALRAMQAALAHRGPDGQGQWAQGPVALAHTRLAMVGLASGAQPLANEDGSLQLVLNGEIYNHRHLRQQLQARGHRMATDSDAEVVLHLYEEHGPDAIDDLLQTLNGPFALALWDQRSQRLLLARDRFGMRPLYWTERPQGWAFASEIKALLTLPDVPRRLDRVALSQTVQFWAPVAPRSAFAGIHSLPPGEWLTLAPGDGAQARPAMRRQRWWDIPWEPSGDGTPARAAPADFSTAAAQLREQLQQATELQLQADVPVGVYLSGGLDSTVLAALAAQAPSGGLGVQAFALGFEDPAYDESAAQDAVAQALGLRLQRITLGRGALAEDFERLVWHAETPLVRSAAAPLMRLARLARDSGVKAVLSGEGADELLAGYDLFKELRIRRLMAGGSATWRSLALQRLYPYLTHSPAASGSLSARWWATTEADWQDPLLPLRSRVQLGRRFAGLLNPAAQARWADTWEPEAQAGLRAELPGRMSAVHGLARAQHLECKGLLAGYLLSSQGDRVAMAEGLELRHPYLDHRVAELLAAVPRAWLLRGLRDKRLLREALRPCVPAALLTRPKQPYRAPDLTGLFNAHGRLPEPLEALLTPERLRDHALLDSGAVGRLLAKCRSGRAIGAGDHQAFVTLLSLLSWQRQFGVDDVAA